MIDTEEWKKVNKNRKSDLANLENDLENKLEPVPARGLETEMASICQEGKKKGYSGTLKKQKMDHLVNWGDANEEDHSL